MEETTLSGIGNLDGSDSGALIMGPKIIWNAADVKKMVEQYGFEDAIFEIAAGIFDPEHIRKVLSDYKIQGLLD